MLVSAHGPETTGVCTKLLTIQKLRFIETYSFNVSQSAGLLFETLIGY